MACASESSRGAAGRARAASTIVRQALGPPAILGGTAGDLHGLPAGGVGLAPGPFQGRAELRYLRGELHQPLDHRPADRVVRRTLVPATLLVRAGRAPPPNGTADAGRLPRLEWPGIDQAVPVALLADPPPGHQRPHGPGHAQPILNPRLAGQHRR
jgi:hypothetical protein